MTDTNLKPVLIVLIDGFADWETPMISAIGRDFYGLSVRHATPGGGEVRSMGGLRVCDLPDVAVQGDEVIVLCGSEGWTRPDAPDLTALLQAAHGRGQTVAGICAGTLALGRAGLLADRAHTSNSLDFLRHFLPGYIGADSYRDQPQAVSEGGVISAPGTAPATFAAQVLRAAGLGEEQVAGFLGMAGAEHR